MELIIQYTLSWCSKDIQAAQAAYSVVVAVEIMTCLSSRKPSNVVPQEDYNQRRLVLSYISLALVLKQVLNHSLSV